MFAFKTLPEASGVRGYNAKPPQHDTPRKEREQSPQDMTRPHFQFAFVRRVTEARDRTSQPLLHSRLELRQDLPLCPKVWAACEARSGGERSLAIHLDPMGLMKPLEVSHV